MKGFIHLNRDKSCSLAWDRVDTIAFGVYDENDNYGTMAGEILIEFQRTFSSVTNQVRFSSDSFPLVVIFFDVFDKLLMYDEGIGIEEFKSVLIGLGFQDITDYEEE